MAISIPEKSKEALRRLASFDDVTTDRLCSALSDERPQLGISSLPDKISAKLGLPASDMRGIVNVLFSLYTVRYEEELSVEALIEELREAIEKTGDAKLVGAESWDAFSKHLRKLLSLEETFGIAVKGLSIAYDNPRHFHSVRILTDARPIFPSDAAQSPKSFLVNHVLKFCIHEDGDEREWFLALSSKDLERLRQAIDRAMSKEKSLTATLSAASATILKWEN